MAKKNTQKTVQKTDKQTREYIKKIDENYKRINELMRAEIHLASVHGGVTGNYREEMWMKFFRNIVPRKFSLSQGVIIIDSEGERSREVDIAIYDDQYTPYVLQYGSLKFIPIEAVAAVVECKSTSPDKTALEEWASSIDALSPSPLGVVRVIQGLAVGVTNRVQQKTRPIKILVALMDADTNTLENDLKDTFDFIIRPKNSDSIDGFSMTLMNEDKTLGWWVNRLNGSGLDKGEDNIAVEYLTNKNFDKKENIEKGSLKSLLEVEKFESPESKEGFKYKLTNTLADLKIKENPILSLTFQLNQLLMLINNPMLFPHFAYAKVFNKILGDKERGEDTLR